MSNTPKKYCGLYTTLFSPEYLKKEYLEREQSLNQIAKQAGCSKKMVLLSIQKHKIPTRSNALANHIRHKRTFNLTKLVKNYIDGLILGDGHILQKTRFSARYDQSFSVRYREWANQIRIDLKHLGIISNMIEYVTKPSFIRKTGQLIPSFPQILLYTMFYEEFCVFRERWYGNGVKTVPKDIELAPETVANWYMGDGYYDTQTGRVAFCTHSCSTEALVLLKSVLKETLGVVGKVYPDRSQDNQPIFKLNRENSRVLLNYTKGLKVDCFNYKWGIN